MPNDYGTGGFDLPQDLTEHFAANQPQLGYGKPSEATIDQVNQWMRSQPWWSQIRGSNQGDLTPQQRQAILKATQANGVVVDEGDMEIDKGGNFNPKGHKLRNTLIVAGIAGATIATMGAAGAFAGGAGAASGAGAGAAGAGAGTGGALASTTIGSGMLGPIAGGTGLAGAAGAAPLAATTIGSGAIGPIAGGTSGAGMAGGAAGGVGANIARRIGDVGADVAKDSFKQKLGSALAAVGGATAGHFLGGMGGSSVPPELQQLLQMSIRQQQDLDQLRQNVTRGVNAMLPTFARGGQ